MTSITPYVCTNCTRQLKKGAAFNSQRLSALFQTFNRRYSNKHIPQDGRPFRMAVIGSGPAGFYTAYKVMSKIDNAVIDMYEQLPTPYGLVRYGVAPDHPEVKNCEDKFIEVAESPNFNFIGNIHIGHGEKALPLELMAPHYDAFCFAYGASKDRKLGIPGEDTIKGIYSARAFVGWYNGLPEFAKLAPDLTLGENAVIIGQGNVALDVARILLKGPDALKDTDITEYARDALRKSKVKNVTIVGRRGPLEAAFTNKELRELINLSQDLPVRFNSIDPHYLPSEADIKAGGRASKRRFEILSKGAQAPPTSSNPADLKSWSFAFRRAPTAFLPSPTNTLASIRFKVTNSPPDAQENVDMPASLAFRSIGYSSEPLPGMLNIGVPFKHSTGTIPNDGLGRILDSATPGGDEGEGSRHVPGMYCAGWVKRGPTGVIASTMTDAFQTAETIAGDWIAGVPFIGIGDGEGLEGGRDVETAGKGGKGGWDAIKVEAEKRGIRTIGWEDWKRIDAEEVRRGKLVGKVREKFGSVEEMLQVLIEKGVLNEKQIAEIPLSK